MAATEYGILPGAPAPSVTIMLPVESPDTQRLLATLDGCARIPLPFVMAGVHWRVVQITLDGSTPSPQIGLIPWEG